MERNVNKEIIFLSDLCTVLTAILNLVSGRESLIAAGFLKLLTCTSTNDQINMTVSFLVEEEKTQ